MQTTPIAIAGGGIAGLAAALALQHHPTAVFEQAPTFAETGAGLQLGPNALHALQALGAWDAVSPITRAPPEVHIRDALSGKMLRRMPLGGAFEKTFGGPYRVAHRADLHAALLQVVGGQPNIEVKTGQPLSHVQTTPDGVSFLNGKTRMLAPAMIAADGVHSAIRQAMFPKTAPVQAPATFHRALFRPQPVSDVALECVNLWLHPQGHVVHYQVGKAENLNFIAITPQHKSTTDFFEKVAAPLAALAEQAQKHFSPWPALYAEPLQSWTKGNLLLLGDAAHGTLPYLAQGAAMALEDAATLAASLTQTHNLQSAFSQTAARRMHRTRKLHLATLRTGETYHLSGVMRHLRNAAMPLLPTAFMNSQLAWIYKWQQPG